MIENASVADERLATIKRYVCTYEGCFAAFGKPSRLEQHIRVHTGEVIWCN